MILHIYPSLAQYRLEKVDFGVLIRMAIISLFLLFIVLPLQFVVMILYTPIAIWNALTSPKYIEPSPPISTELEMELA